MQTDGSAGNAGTAPPAPHRIGEPSPLIFHLKAALSGYQQALLAAPKAGDARFPWAPHLREAARALGALDQVAVAAEIGRRLSTMLAGIEAWQRHPYRRAVAAPPSIWRAGASRLLDYGAAPEAARPDGQPVLVVPSLINRAYILDLLPERSLIRWLAGRGFRPVLLDWGEPGSEERALDIDGYGRERLLPALEHLHAATHRRIGVVGYCMGGTIAIGLAARAPRAIASLATIGAPWDFSGASGVTGGLRTMMRAGGSDRIARSIDALGGSLGTVPVCLFQLLFALINPMQAATKFQRFARLDPASAAARHFVALEDWLTDGVPMARGAAKDLLVGWQIENRTARERWRFLGEVVRPGSLGVPSIAFCGQSDSIAPTAATQPLPRAIPGARMVAPRTGHVGMIVGSAAPSQVWTPLADFLGAHPG